ncbi:tail fiber domain-containing protein [Emticicia sp. BO119]|uniref:tail fiber domain-containing protein n=1 Tax=Emticicia sp. BO119 TaxID=2757768 RepID=UPI0015F0AD3E|nr:tail fiber domain-containing protein [Emticicia sp. BO119]MBA4852026.1 tail fiber domain-containing protein [Emticicia sp. BO119]
MKKLLLFLFISYCSYSQIETGGIGGSVTISPNGFHRNYYLQAPQYQLSGDIAIGSLALNKNQSGLYNIGIGNHVMENMFDGLANIAIGQEAMKYSPRTELNIAIGMRALSNTSGWNNLGLGNNALANNTSGTYNIAIGASASGGNTTGSNNISLGTGALGTNTNGSFNTAIGVRAMVQSSTGSDNIALGNSVLYYNQGELNFGAGHESLYKNISGSYNVALGRGTLYNNLSGNYSTAIGYQAGSNNTGSFNTFVGHNADISAGDWINATALGYGATVDASNKVRIGNSAVSVIEGQVPWSNPSDRRLKENILYTNRLGLDFITRLQTVSYNYIADDNKTRHDGFIAQDVEKVMQELGVPFSGLKKSSTGTYSLAYSDFVMPLANAIKEQQAQIEELKKQYQLLSARLSEIDEIKAELERMKVSSKSEASK